MENSILGTAVKAYVRYCQNNGLIYQQPNEALCRVDQKYVYLENINGLLAKYDIKERRIFAL